MKTLPKECIDLIYIDPPFFTQRDFGEYTDKWDSSQSYLDYMKVRLIEMHRILKNTGSIYLHCDHRANYRLRMLLDDIFGEKRFINEIIWDYKKVSNSKAYKLLRAHDTILFYSKTRQYSFNRLFEKIVSERKKQLIKQGYNTKNMNGEKYLYIYDYKKTENMDKNKFDHIININPNEGNAYTDVFKIDFLNSNSKENIGYKTQKPLALLDRIIKTSSNKGDLVADFFCGSGTTLHSAYNNNRQYIGCDINKNAVKIANKRLTQLTL